MLDSITPATPADFDAVWQLYVDVCTHMSLDVYDPGWILGVFPCEEDIRSFTEAGELYVGDSDDHELNLTAFRFNGKFRQNSA